MFSFLFLLLSSTVLSQRLSTGPRFPGTCDLSVGALIEDGPVVTMVDVSCISTLSIDGLPSICVRLFVCLKKATMDYRLEDECPAYLFYNLYPQLEEFLIQRQIFLLAIKDESLYTPLRFSPITVQTVLLNALLLDNPISFFHTLGFIFTHQDQIQLILAMEILHNYTCGDFMRDIGAIGMRSMPLRLFSIFNSHRYTLLSIVVQTFCDMQGLETTAHLVYIFQKMKELGGDGFRMFREFTKEDRFMVKRLALGQDVAVVDGRRNISDDEESMDNGVDDGDDVMEMRM
jgi:hypothetical protein